MYHFFLFLLRLLSSSSSSQSVSSPLSSSVNSRDITVEGDIVAMPSRASSSAGSDLASAFDHFSHSANTSRRRASSGDMYVYGNSTSTNSVINAKEGSVESYYKPSSSTSFFIISYYIL
jgi:hypothetical protein